MLLSWQANSVDEAILAGDKGMPADQRPVLLGRRAIHGNEFLFPGAVEFRPPMRRGGHEAPLRKTIKTRERQDR